MKKVSYFAIIAILALVTTSCNKGNIVPLKSSSLKLNFSAVNNKILSGTREMGTGFVMTSMRINIKDVIIEENSGNDVQQQGNQNNGGVDIAEGTPSNESGSDAPDIKLSGPFVLDISDSTTSIKDIGIYPGTFKKVDFTFTPNHDGDFSGKSILLKGNYIDPSGNVIPVILKSAFNQQVQVPLANGGMTVTSKSNVNVSIILNVQNWMLNIDLASAKIINGVIQIDSSNNTDVLSQFNVFLSSKIEADN